MGREDQGVAKGRNRYQVIPRTLCFVTHGDEVLLLLGGPHKKLWAGRYNGLGRARRAGRGHLRISAHEVREESGLDVHDVRLRCVVHADAGNPAGVILFFVFTAAADGRTVRSPPRARWRGCRSMRYRPSTWWRILPVLLPKVLSLGRDDPPIQRGVKL